MTHDENLKGGDPRGPRTPGGIPGYDLVQFIESRGLGDVWLARDLVTKASRVVNIIYESDPARLRQEVERLRLFQRCAAGHPNILQVLDIGETKDCHYCIMEAADNGSQAPSGRYELLTLRRWMQRSGRLAPRGALALLQPIAAGVAHLHAQRLVHCEPEPENILIVCGEPKIGSAGGAALQKQSSGRQSGLSCPGPSRCGDDLFALGKVLYELVTARPPEHFPSLPPDLADNPTPEATAAIGIMNRACHPNRKKAYARIGEIEAELAAALPPEAGRISAWRRFLNGGLTSAVA